MKHPAYWPCWQRRVFLIVLFVPGLVAALAQILYGAAKGAFSTFLELYEETCEGYRFLWKKETGFEPREVEPDPHQGDDYWGIQ